MNAREHDIVDAHPNTCNWLSQTMEFQEWWGRSDLSSHNGILWIKGKPGAGKSVLMKHTLYHCRKFFTDHVIAAHFFHTRGTSLEKTFLGMLRSLSYQLLDQDPLLFERFIPMIRNKQKSQNPERRVESQNPLEWREEELREYLLSEIKTCQSKPLLLLIDALDECNQGDVVQVILFLESLSRNAINADVALNICLSSRHYPNVSMERSIQLVVEARAEHGQDINVYVRDVLRVSDERIKIFILEKASGLFMWVILVVTILNQAYDKDKVEAMYQMLHELPYDLEELFHTLLSEDSPDKRETVFLLQCVLFSRRALSPEELYFAVMARINPQNVGAWDRSKVTREDIQRRITASSRGLIEIRSKGRDSIVQFIHESVNDFLLRNRRLETLDPRLELNVIGQSHDYLRACCMSYLMMSELPLAKEDSQAKELSFNYPFLEYASTYVLDHAEEAQGRGIMQKEFVHCLQQQNEKFERLRHFHNAFEKIPDLGCGKGVTPLYTFSFHGYHELVKVILSEEQIDINVQGGGYGNALQAASAEGKKEVVALLLGNGADVNAQGGAYGNPLQAALAEGKNNVVDMLLENGADANAHGGLGSSALQTTESKDKSDLTKNNVVYSSPSTYRRTIKFVIITTAFAAFFILWRKGFWKGLGTYLGKT